MDLSQNFVCPICLELAKGAVESSCCAKIYCEKCISDMFKKFQHCPCCRSKSLTWSASRIARKVISQIKVPCEFCNSQVETGMMENHLTKCPKVIISCKICINKMEQGEITKHTATAHEKEAKEYLIRYVLGLNNKNQSKVSQSVIKPPQPQQRNFFKPVTNRIGRVAKLGTVAKYYCGGDLIGKCSCCDGHCGPDNGQNCDACMQLDIKRLNLNSKYLVNPLGYVCFAFPVQGIQKVCCNRVIQMKSKGLFSKPEPIICKTGQSCYSCRQVENSILIGRYNNMY